MTMPEKAATASYAFGKTIAPSSGRGAAVPRALTHADPKVILDDVNLAGLHTVASPVRGAPGVEVNVASPESSDRVAASKSAFDVAVNDAGIDLLVNIAHTPVEDFSRLMRMNRGWTSE